MSAWQENQGKVATNTTRSPQKISTTIPPAAVRGNITVNKTRAKNPTHIESKKLGPVNDTSKLRKKTKSFGKISSETPEIVGKNSIGGGKSLPGNQSTANRFKSSGLMTANKTASKKSSLVFSESEDSIKVTLRRHKSKTKAKD